MRGRLLFFILVWGIANGFTTHNVLIERKAFVRSHGDALPLLSLKASNDVLENGPKVSIRYCTGCRWMLRASWLAQELLTTFQDDLGSVELIPSRPPEPGGIFIVTLDETTIWDRSEEKRFPEAKELKQKIRDVIAPEKNLGHSDVKSSVAAGSDEKCEDCPPSDVDEMDDEEAREARRYFGVL